MVTVGDDSSNAVATAPAVVTGYCTPLWMAPWDSRTACSRQVYHVNNGLNGQRHEPRRLMGMFYVLLRLCREILFLEIWFKFSWFNF